MRKILIFISMIFTLFACNANKDSNPGKNSSNVNSSNNIVNKKLTKEDVAGIYSNAAKYMNGLYNNEGNNNVRRKYQESDDFDTLQSMTALVKFADNLYNNETFVFVDKIVKFNLTLNDDKVDFYLITEYDIPNNKFNAAAFLGGEGPLFEGYYYFYYFDLDYDFTNAKINGFEIRQGSLNDDEINLHFKYENNVFYEYDPFLDDEDVSYVRKANNSSSSTGQKNINYSSNDNQETTKPLSIKEQTLALRDKYKEMLVDAYILDQDYTNEYESAMLYAFGGNH